MAAIPTILKGDQPEPIAISLAEGFDYGEATLHVKYKGIERTFTGLSGGSTLQLALTSEDTARMCLGAAAVGMWLVYPGGRIRTIPSDDVRIKVTDSPAEVYNAPIALLPATLPPDATESDSLGDLKAKYNALKAALAAGCAALCVLVSSAAGISGAPPNAIPGNAMVVTNVTFDGLAKLEDLKDAGVSAEAVTNIVKAVAPKPEDYTTTNAVKDIVTAADDVYEWRWHGDVPAGTLSIVANEAGEPARIYIDGEYAGFTDALYSPGTLQFGPFVMLPDYEIRFFYGEKMIVGRRNKLGLARMGDLPPLTNGIPEAIASQQSQMAKIKQDTDAMWSFVTAENFRVAVTNYDSTAHAPEASFEYRMNTNESFRVVWAETNGLTRTHTSATNDAIRAAKAEIAKPENRAWGHYDATTGAPAPEGIVQVSAEGGIMIGGGMGYTSVTAKGGEYWVLSATDPTLCRTGTNGVFEIIDSSGNAAVTVRKGDKRLVPAPAGSINVTDTSIVISYLIESAEHPEIECSATLYAGGTWYAAGAEGAPFGAAVWTGSSGAWVATIPKGTASAGFLRASYWAGGGTVVSYGAAAMDMQRVKIGKVEYTVGTATISGHTVLTLEVAP